MRRFLSTKRPLAREISRITRYSDGVIHYLPIEHDDGSLLELLEAPEKLVASSPDALPDSLRDPAQRRVVLMDGTLNHHLDIQKLLEDLRAKLGREARVAAILYNPYFKLLVRLATRVGLRRGAMPTTFLTETDLGNLAKLAGFEIVRGGPICHVPIRCLGLEDLLNPILAVIPGIRWLALSYVAVLRPVLPEGDPPSLSIVVPARNEKGNVGALLERIPPLSHGGRPARIEVVFVEGHSTDGTWQEILRVAGAHEGRFGIVTLQQTGEGKADAVRLGFSRASGDLLVVLDADLSVPPEDLVKFYQAYCRGLADFVNGSRLVYPMEGQAMRFLNWVGNVFFAKALSWVLGVKIGDSLCGTKLFGRQAYLRFQAWRAEFGEFDPFGDFELLFPAAILALGIVDVPVYYRARTYGATNIQRFRHGWMLLRMTLLGTVRVKLGLF